MSLVSQSFCRAELSKNRYNVAVRACSIDLTETACNLAGLSGTGFYVDCGIALVLGSLSRAT